MARKTWRTKFAKQIRYYRTPRGVLSRAYTQMQARVRSVEGYKGLPICTREEFIKFFINDETFLDLHMQWVGNYFRKYLRPTPDRIEPQDGYILDNIRWRTYIDNVTDASGFKRQQFKESYSV